jgi:hypothetical protein
VNGEGRHVAVDGRYADLPLDQRYLKLQARVAPLPLP